MKNLFSILCVFALVAVTLGASATPIATDTSPDIVCVVDIGFDTDATCDVFTLTPAPCVPASIGDPFTCSTLGFGDLPVPDSPNIGFDMSFEDPVTLGILTITTEPDLPDPTVGTSAECSHENGANETTVNTESDPDLPDPTVGTSAECSHENGANETTVNTESDPDPAPDIESKPSAGNSTSATSSSGGLPLTTSGQG